MAELDTIYIYAIVGGLMITAVYYALRLRIEMKKEQSARASFMSMVKYHSQRLDIEMAQPELQQTGKTAFKVTRPEPRPMPEATEEEPTVLLGGTMVKNIAEGAGKPAMMSDEEFAARIKKIREMGQ